MRSLYNGEWIVNMNANNKNETETAKKRGKNIVGHKRMNGQRIKQMDRRSNKGGGCNMTHKVLQKWRWAGQLVRKTDNRWTRRLSWNEDQEVLRVHKQRLKQRWNDKIVTSCDKGWMSLILDRHK